MTRNNRPARAPRRRSLAAFPFLGGPSRPLHPRGSRRLALETFEKRVLLDSNGVIAGTKFRDLTGDGVSPDDVPFAGTTIQLIRDVNGDGQLTGADAVTASQVTNALGQYSFSGLDDGTYFVREVVPAGASQTGGPAFYTVALSGIGPGSVLDVTIDGFDSPAAPTSYLINNSNPDPTFIQQSAPTILGGQRDLTVDVLGVSGPVSAGGDLGGGSYNFISAAPGAQATLQYDGADASGANALLLPVTNFLAGGNDRVRLDFLSVDAGPGTQMAITIRLTSVGGGTATFTGNVPENASAQSFFATFASFVQGGGFDFTQVNSIEVGFNEVVGAADVDFELQLIELTQVQQTGGFNFTNFFDNTIGGFKVEDLTGDGFSADDVPLGGTTIQLYLDDGDSVFEPDTDDTLVDTQVSSAGGAYAFLNLAPARYFVREVVPPNSVQTAGQTVYSILLVGEQNSSGNNFGNFRFGTLSGTKFGDVTGNGISADDVPLANVAIQLFLDDGDNVFEPGAGDNLVDTKLTDAAGNYSFVNLGPGRYFVREIVPAGSVQTSAPDFYNVLLISNSTVDTLDFANRPLPSSISGFVYADVDNDGNFDFTESPIPGTTVTLIGTTIFGTPVNVATQTDVNGFYIFSNLLPGNYQLVETQPFNFIDGIDTIGTPGGTGGNDIFSNILLPANFDGVNNNFGERGLFPNKTQLFASHFPDTLPGNGGDGTGGGNGDAAVAGLVLGSSAQSTVAVFDPNGGVWYINDVNAAGAPATTVAFGAPGWTPLSGDWDGDGTDTLGMFDPATATFYLRNSNTAGAPDFTPFRFGNLGWIPVVGDWDGDGVDTIGVVNPATSTFYLRNSNSAGAADIGPFNFGGLSFRPIAGDWDGDGVDTIGAYNPFNAVFYLRNSNSGGAADAGSFIYGGVLYRPLVGDWDGDGVDTIGVYEAFSMDFYLRNSNTSGAADITPFRYGGAGFLATAGAWFGASTPLLAAGGAVAGSGESLRSGALQTMVDAAINRWAGAGLSAQQQALLRTVKVTAANLSGNALAVAVGHKIFVDLDAAGYGWFTDQTAGNDNEFNVLAGDSLLATKGPAAHKMDLLTVLSHELGHVLGLTDLDPMAHGNDLMSAALSTGMRRTPTAAEVDALFGG